MVSILSRAIPGTIPLTTAVRQALEQGAEATAIALAFREGMPSESGLTDLVFRARHPERRGAVLKPQERTLIREWLGVRDRIVRPTLVLVRAARPPVPAPPAPATGFRPIPVERPGATRIRDKREPAAGDLVTVQGVNGPVLLHPLAAEAWTALVAAARADGISAPVLLSTSGYRSVARQRELWDAALQRYGSPAEARKWVAPPGGSPHHSGRAIDVYLGGRNASENVENLRQLPAYLWLVRNAVRFGFYPYDREPWHWEYNPPADTELEAEIGRVLARLFRPDRAAAARRHFNNKLRDKYAPQVGVGPGGQVHHAIELQVLKRYPGVFTPEELNRLENMRGIPMELARRRQLHNAKIRELWNRYYGDLDADLKRTGFSQGTAEYRDLVRGHLESGRDAIDHVLGQFFSGYRRGFDWTRPAA